MSEGASRIDRVRARLELPEVRRAVGLREGRHRSVLQGHGQDFDDLALYTPGDDVGDIDWKSSARAGGVPVIKRYQRDSSAPVVLAVDTGRTMAATAAGGESKRAVARHVAEAVGVLAGDRGDPVGLLAGDAGRLVRVPARTGRMHLELVLRRLERALEVDGPAPDLRRVLARVHATSLTPSLVVVLSDAVSLVPARVDVLARLVARHSLLVLTVADADPLAPGADPARDVLDGWTVPAALRGRADLGRAVAAHRQAQTAARDAMLRRLGVPHATVGSTEDALTALASALDRRRRAAR
ncbi:MAG TPA: DUF58 domain-containing protein [Cellulomonas sp.]